MKNVNKKTLITFNPCSRICSISFRKRLSTFLASVCVNGTLKCTSRCACHVTMCSFKMAAEDLPSQFDVVILGTGTKYLR